MRKKIILLLLFIIMIIMGIDDGKAYKTWYKNDNEQIEDDGYLFSPKFNSSAGYVLSNDVKNWPYKCGNGNKKQKNDKGCYKTSSQYDLSNLTSDNIKNKEFYIIYKKIGKINNKYVDMKIKLDHIVWNGNTKGSFRFQTNGIGVYNAATGADKDSHAEFFYNISFTYSDGSTIKSFKGIINFTDLDYGEQVSFSKDSVYKFYRLNTSNYLGSEVNHVDMEDSGNRVYVKTNRKLVLDCINQKDAREVECTDKGGIYKAYLDYDDGKQVLPDKSYDGLSRDELVRKAGSASILFNKNTISMGWSGYYTSLQNAPFTKNLESAPVKEVWYKGISYDKNTIDVNSTSDYSIRYTFDLTVPKQDKAWYYKLWTIEDQLPSEIELENSNVYKSVKVIDKDSGKNVTWIFKNKGSITYSNNKLTLSADSDYLIKSGGPFYGRTFVVQVRAKIKGSTINELQDNVSKEIINKVSHSYVFKKDGSSYKLSSDDVKFYIKKTSPPSDSCETKLTSIKDTTYSNNVILNNVLKIYKLKDLYLYEKNHYGHNYNGLFNYSVTSDMNFSIDFSKTVCAPITDCDDSNIFDSNSSLANSFSCSGKSIIDSAKSENHEDTVCYAGDNDNFGSYYSQKLDAYCEVSYDFVLPFSDTTVTSGSLLWGNPIESKLNDSYMKFDITCFNAYENSCDANKNLHDNFILEPSEFIDDILPNISLKWKLNKKNLVENLQYSIDNIHIIGSALKDVEQSDNILHPQYFDAKDDENNDICFARWNAEFKTDINYETSWFVDSNGVYKSHNDGNLAHHAGYGLPVTLLDNELKMNIIRRDSAKLNITNPFAGDESISLDCPYTIKNEYFDDDDDDDGGGDDGGGNSLKVNFRTIDTSNPFPGISGNGRLTGSNWCNTSLIGSSRYDSDGNKYIVGDINGDGKITVDADSNVSLENFKNSNKYVTDINDDGEVTYPLSGICSNLDYENDYCALTSIFSLSYEIKNRQCIGDSERPFIKKYITDTPNSSSNLRPMYSFTINSSDIQNIREYNKYHSYKDFDLECDNGNDCMSEFLTNLIYNNKIDIDGQIRNMSIVNNDNSICYGWRNPHGGNNMCNNLRVRE